jgi:tight adherence protein B
MDLPNIPDSLLFAILVFIAAVLLALTLTTPTVGSEAMSLKRTRERIKSLMSTLTPEATSLLLKRQQDELSPLAKLMQTFPGIESLSTLLKQLGSKTPAHMVLAGCAALAAVTFVLLLLFRAPIIPVLVLPLMVGYLPIFNLKFKRQKRIDLFEEQLPEALSMMARAMRAGLPFADALRATAAEMPEPLGPEFTAVFADITYGLGVKDGLVNLMTRVPSLSLQTMVTAVLVQRETGGNLSEILEKIAAVVRGRHKLYRKVKSLSAEGRMSAWVLVMIPLLLGVLISFSSPTYLPLLLKDPIGQKMLWTMFGLLLVGVLWIRKIINIQV